MAKLVLSLDGSILGNYFIETDRLTLGRTAANDVHIFDQAVSKEHAVILTVGNDQILEDLGSTNGTVVNGQKVKKHILQNGDVIELGRYRLKYLNQKASPDMDFDKTMITRGLNAGAKEESEDSVVTGATSRDLRTALPQGILSVISGIDEGHTIKLERVLTTCGTLGVQLAVITRRPHGYFLTHVDGKTTPAINGTPIGQTPHLLKDQDVIKVANEELRFSLA